MILEFLVRFLAYRDLVSVITTIQSSNSTQFFCYKKKISVEVLKSQFSKHRTPGKKNGGCLNMILLFKRRATKKPPTSTFQKNCLVMVG